MPNVATASEFFNRIGQLQTVALKPQSYGKEAFAWDLKPPCERAING